MEWRTIAEGYTRMIAPRYAIFEAMQRNGLDKNKIIVLPHGIHLPTFVPSFPSVTNGKVKFFYVGRICYVKGLHILLQAFSSVNDPCIELHLIGRTGNKTERRYAHQLKKQYASDSRIIWHGKVAPEQVFNTIQDFHILVHPAIYIEVFGLNIAESLAMGKLVLATRCGGLKCKLRKE